MGTAGISSDDPRAPEKLEAKASILEEQRAMMKRANAHWKKHGTLEGFEELSQEGKLRVLRGMALMHDKVPFSPYALQNIGARIRQAKQRVEHIAARDETPAEELAGDGF